MKRGKRICSELKAIRRKIADENGINMDIPECTYTGDCRGTCPRCEWEVKYLEKNLFERLKLGKIATISGIALGLSSCGGADTQLIQATGDSVPYDIENVQQDENTLQQIDTDDCYAGVVLFDEDTSEPPPPPPDYWMY